MNVRQVYRLAFRRRRRNLARGNKQLVPVTEQEGERGQLTGNQPTNHLLKTEIDDELH